MKFIKYVRHFLSGRNTRVEVNGTRSNSFRLNQGLPQGSSISPLLILVFINDIDIYLDADTIASLFADDTAIWMTDGQIRGSKRVLMQAEIDQISFMGEIVENEDQGRQDQCNGVHQSDIRWKMVAPVESRRQEHRKCE